MKNWSTDAPGAQTEMHRFLRFPSSTHRSIDRSIDAIDCVVTCLLRGPPLANDLVCCA